MINRILLHPLRAPVLASVLAALCTPFYSAHAQTAAPMGGSVSSAVAQSSLDTSIPVEQRVRSQLRAAIAELIASGAFGDQAPQNLSVDIDAPAETVTDLGVLVDSSGHRTDGLQVLGVTPGSAAEKMGLRTGDVLVSANGTSLGGSGTAAASSLRYSVDHLANGKSLAFEIERAGRAQTVSGPLNSVYVPAMQLHIGNAVQVASNTTAARDAVAMGGQDRSSCGRISDFDVAPRQQQLHSAKIILIDGQAPGPSGATSFRVAAGQHVVTVVNRIESQYLPFNDMQRNAGVSNAHYKKITIDVAPDTTTLIAARLNTDKRNDWQHDAYWDPVAWKQVTETCR